MVIPSPLRPVSSEDAMTADWTRVPYDVLAHISTRITNEVPGVNRVVLDVTSKPRARSGVGVNGLRTAGRMAISSPSSSAVSSSSARRPGSVSATRRPPGSTRTSGRRMPHPASATAAWSTGSSITSTPVPFSSSPLVTAVAALLQRHLRLALAIPAFAGVALWSTDHLKENVLHRAAGLPKARSACPAGTRPGPRRRGVPRPRPPRVARPVGSLLGGFVAGAIGIGVLAWQWHPPVGTSSLGVVLIVAALALAVSARYSARPGRVAAGFDRAVGHPALARRRGGTGLLALVGDGAASVVGIARPYAVLWRGRRGHPRDGVDGRPLRGRRGPAHLPGSNLVAQAKGAA